MPMHFSAVLSADSREPLLIESCSQEAAFQHQMSIQLALDALPNDECLLVPGGGFTGDYNVYGQQHLNCIVLVGIDGRDPDPELILRKVFREFVRARITPFITI